MKTLILRTGSTNRVYAGFLFSLRNTRKSSAIPYHNVKIESLVGYLSSINPTDDSMGTVTMLRENSTQLGRRLPNRQLD